eukprot:1741627-Rhodomonas_salina.2
MGGSFRNITVPGVPGVTCTRDEALEVEAAGCWGISKFPTPTISITRVLLVLPAANPGNIVPIINNIMHRKTQVPVNGYPGYGYPSTLRLT